MSKRAELEKVLKDLNKKKNLRLGFNDIPEIEYYETPFVTFNKLTGGGFPKAKYTTIAGPEKTGKTTLILQTIGYLMSQDPEFTVLWTDAEDTLTKKWSSIHGIDEDRFILQRYSQDAESFEKLADDAIKIIETGGVNMWVIDSVGALLTKAEMEKDVNDETMLTLPRKLSLFFRKTANTVSNNKVCCLLIGQVYTVPAANYAQYEVKGGNALKHWASLRIMTRRGNKDEAPPPVKIRMPDGETRQVPSGWAQHLKVDKTKLNENEGQEILLQFILGRGLDSVTASITALLGSETIERKGGWYYHDKLPDGKIQGKDTLISFLTENRSVLDEIVKELDQDNIANIAMEENIENKLTT